MTRRKRNTGNRWRPRCPPGERMAGGDAGEIGERCSGLLSRAGPSWAIACPRSRVWEPCGGAGIVFRNGEEGHNQGRPYRGISSALPRPGGGGARSAGGVGEREERGVLMRCRQNAQSGFSPRLRPSRALTTIAPDPAREPRGRSSTVLLDGEGVPSPAPPPDDFFHGPVHGMVVVKGKIGAGSPGPAFPGVYIRPAPDGGGVPEARAGRG